KLFMDLSKQLGLSFNDLTRRVNGYWYEVSTHSGVAAAIAQNRADVGICSEYAAKSYGLDYIPLTWELYDFAINARSMEKEFIQRFIEVLASPEARDLVNSFKGYEASEDMGSKICC
ncbi:MAG: substrate-binding domain-containing protein, partial [Ignisphaera sp.]